MTDRVLYGEVIDFLDFRLFGGYIWPTFNLADCWIVCGVAILMLDILFEPSGENDPPMPDSFVEGEDGSGAVGK